MPDGRARVSWVRLGLIPVWALAVWVLLDVLLPPTGKTVVDAFTAIRTAPAELGVGSSLHALAGVLTAMLVDQAVDAVRRRLKKRSGGRRR